MELFNAFNKVSAEDWRTKIEADLKGKDYQETLVWSSKEGIDVQPFYNSSSLSENLSTPLKLNNQWEIRESIVVGNIESSNEKALLALKGGSNSICFVGDIKNQEEMNALLKGIDVSIIDVHFYTSNLTQTASLCLPNSGSISFDFLGEQLTSSTPIDIDELEKITTSKNNIKTIAINGSAYNNNNTTVVEELAITLSHAVEYLNLLTDKGLTADTIARKMQFKFSVGTNYFFEIAKIRAVRILWDAILKEFSVENVAMHIHAETVETDFSEENTASNILRNTTKAMAAIIGGCDSLTILPHDKTEGTLDFSNRIARNIQHLLKEEAFFDKVNNPADGSYYIENLTHQIAKKSLELFQEIEKQGGYLACLENNFIQNKLNATVHA